MNSTHQVVGQHGVSSSVVGEALATSSDEAVASCAEEAVVVLTFPESKIFIKFV